MKLNELKKHLTCDTISKRNGIITVRQEFFYRHGGTSESYKDLIRRELLLLNYSCHVINYGEVYKPFKGGASVANSSHWYVKFKLLEEVK